MKNLLYKEFKLVFHVSIALIIILFPMMALIPSYPRFIGFMYIIVIYPLIFLGVNKGQNNNDIFYSLTLPVSRKQIVMARVIFLMILQAVMVVLYLIFFSISPLLHSLIPPEELVEIGFPNSAFLITVSFSIIAFGILDLVFLPIFYLTARSIFWPIILGSFTFSAVITVLNVVLPYAALDFTNFVATCNPLIHIAFLGGAIVIYLALHFLTYYLSAKNFEKVDF